MDSAEAMARALASLGVGGVEIEYRLKEHLLRALLPLLRAADLKVVSLHHPVPLAEGAPPRAASGDYLALSSPSPTDRKAGIAAATRSLEFASSLEAGVVVFHLGWIPEVEPFWAGFRRLYQDNMTDSEEAARLRAEAVERRSGLVGPYLDRAMLSLDKLLGRAERLGVKIALENRYYFHEVPSVNETAAILDAFRGAPVGYWHDVGHASTQERIGFASQRAVLERFQDHLLGVHLHDAQGLDDHLPPGAGTLDFAALSKPLAAAPLKVLEVRPAPPEQMTEAVALLRDVGIS
ncbi:MAG: TIM barrel protein [Pseudomonadota bacterium]